MSQATILFALTARYANERSIKIQGVKDLCEEFGAAFDTSLGAEGFAVYAQEFARLVRPGMSETPEQILVFTREQIEYAKNQWALLEGEAESDADGDAQPVDSVSDDELREKAIAERQAREEAEAKARSEKQKAESNLLEPKKVEDIQIETLKIDPRAKKALRKEGLDTDGDVWTYASAKPLEAIHGIVPDMAKATLAAIEALRAQSED